MLLGATIAQAQPVAPMKMSIENVPGIASPENVDTRLGTLNFFDGFPNQGTVNKVYDNLDVQRAGSPTCLHCPP